MDIWQGNRPNNSVASQDWSVEGVPTHGISWFVLLCEKTETITVGTLVFKCKRENNKEQLATATLLQLSNATLLENALSVQTYKRKSRQGDQSLSQTEITLVTTVYLL